MGNVAGSDVSAGRFAVTLLVVKEDVGAESPQEQTLVHSAQK